MFELITSALSGGLVGLIGTGFKQWQERKEREANRAHDLKMRELDQADMRLEAELALRQTEVEFEGKMGVAAIELQSASYENDKATYSQGMTKSGFMRGLLAFVDVLRGMMRPTITGYLLIIESIIMFKLYVMLDGMGGMLTDDISTLFSQIIQSIIFLTSTSVTWWFGSRPNQARK